MSGRVVRVKDAFEIEIAIFTHEWEAQIYFLDKYLAWIQSIHRLAFRFLPNFYLGNLQKMLFSISETVSDVLFSFWFPSVSLTVCLFGSFAFPYSRKSIPALTALSFV